VGYGTAGFGVAVSTLPCLVGTGEAADRRELMDPHSDAIEVDV